MSWPLGTRDIAPSDDSDLKHVCKTRNMIRCGVGERDLKLHFQATTRTLGHLQSTAGFWLSALVMMNATNTNCYFHQVDRRQSDPVLLTWHHYFRRYCQHYSPYKHSYLVTPLLLHLELNVRLSSLLSLVLPFSSGSAPCSSLSLNPLSRLWLLCSIPLAISVLSCEYRWMIDIPMHFYSKWEDLLSEVVILACHWYRTCFHPLSFIDVYYAAHNVRRAECGVSKKAFRITISILSHREVDL